MLQIGGEGCGKLTCHYYIVSSNYCCDSLSMLSMICDIIVIVFVHYK